MSEPFVAEITIFGFSFAPRGWALCQGQILPISQNTALFSLLGTMYGGNGQSTFALPNLQDSTANSFGQGPGLEDYSQGQVGGAPNVTLQTGELPQHNHVLNATLDRGTTTAANGNVLGTGAAGPPLQQTKANFYSTNSTTTQLSPAATGFAGSSLPHNNMQPYLTLNFCIAMQGVFPPRG
jgi:microcystin-dependent protein